VVINKAIKSQVSKHESLWMYITFSLLGFSSLIWFLIRVIPKPSRAAYPCMRVAAPLASSFVVYLLGIFSSVLVLRKARKYMDEARYLIAGMSIVICLLAVSWTLTQTDKLVRAIPLSAPHPPNDPIGEAQGIFPGRVIWVWNPDATNENCTNTCTGDTIPDNGDDGWFLDDNTNQDVIDRMLSDALKNLSSKCTETEAWDALFKYFNWKKHNLEDTGYTSGEKIFIKINATSAWIYGTNRNITVDCDIVENENYGIAETSPQLVLSTLRQLVNVCGIAQEDISVGDPMKYLYNHCYDKWYAEFPNVNYLANKEGCDRQGFVPGFNPVIYYSDKGTVMDSARVDTLYTVMEETDYMINIPALKAHECAGITLFGKNHFGSNTRGSAAHLHPSLVAPWGNPERTDMGMYRIQVDLMGHELISRNTMLYLLDALWAGPESIKGPTKWDMDPFDTDWTSSIFASQDIVAIESVGYDFLRTEYNGEGGKVPHPNMGGVDDYLHQTADSTWWPEGIIYDPENDGSPIPSLGVHEHWNDSLNREYSRNLDPVNGKGIELISISSGDVISPVIEDISPENFADVAQDSTSIPVIARICDLSSGVLQDSVFLIYTIEVDTSDTTVSMVNVGGDIYRAYIEALPYDTDVNFRIVAYDSLFNKTVSQRMTFEVTDAVTLLYDDGVPSEFDYVPETGEGFSNKFNVHEDSLCVLYKIMFFVSRENGRFDVVVDSVNPRPGWETEGYNGISNGQDSNTFFQFEIPDSIIVIGPNPFWVGLRYVSPDTLSDPQLRVDKAQDFSRVCYRFSEESWSEVLNGDTMIRVKVKVFPKPPVIIEDEMTGASLPRVFAISQNYPNPFNPQTTICYDIPEREGKDVLVKINIYNVRGQQVKTLVDCVKEPGSYKVQWNGKDKRGDRVSSGIYFYKIKAGDFISTRRMVLLK
jgi:hypothetical protein